MFKADRTTNLITRLQYNVIRTGLRRINLAYSRISLTDVAEKLCLPSADVSFVLEGRGRRGGHSHPGWLGGFVCVCDQDVRSGEGSVRGLLPLTGHVHTPHVV